MPRLLWPSWRWMTISGTPSRAISTAWAWRSWCGAKRRRTPASAAVWRSCSRAAACVQARPTVWSGQDAEQRTDGQFDADSQPLLQLLPGPIVHADFAATAALAAADEDCAAAGVEVSLRERKRFVNAQPGAPEHHDQPAHPQAVRRGTSLAHDGDDFFDRRRVGGIATALVAWRSAGVEARHRGR